MLKVWRGKGGRLFADCTSCGSFGTAGHLQPKVRMEPEIEAALERHTATMITYRKHFEKAAGVIARQVKDGSLHRRDGASKIRDIWTNHCAQVRLAEASLPDPAGKVTELATNCPWCGVPEEVEIETLPEDKDEPDYPQAVSVKEFIVASMKKGA